MDCDSTSSCEDRLLDLEGSKKVRRKTSHTEKEIARPTYNTEVHPSSGTSQQKVEIRPETSVGIMKLINPSSLSSQVMEYYHKYSRSPNLDQYFSLPGARSGDETPTYRWQSRSEALLALEMDKKQQEKEIRPVNEVLNQHGRWVRPPLIGQPSGASSEIFACSYLAKGTSYVPTFSSEPENRQFPIEYPESKAETVPAERSQQIQKKTDSLSIELLDTEGKAVSPTSSVTSHKPLEWDSGADVGYHNALPRNNEKQRDILCSIERMALTRELCSTALRLDPEGTTGSTVDPGSGNRIFSVSSRTGRKASKPDANSTRLIEDYSGFEGEIEITPIVKTNMPGIITGNIIVKDDDRVGLESVFTTEKNIQQKKEATVSDAVNTISANKIVETPKISTKYATERIMRPKFIPDFQEKSNMMKKSASLNVLALKMSLPALSLTRSQSELHVGGKTDSDFNGKDRSNQVPLNFASSSSIATIVNKPVTCDKDVQTNLIEKASVSTKESVGIQVSSLETSESEIQPKIRQDKAHNITVNQETREEKEEKEEEEEKPPLPKRISSLSQNKLQSILKNSANQDKSVNRTGSSQSESHEGTVPSDGGRASNSFEYFPGHVYQNVAQTHGESTSHVSSIDTGISHSTMPNTSSSLDEKLWGDSDSLLRDLERSLNVLKCLVDANKCDKYVKKRLIHHVIKRLVTVKYNDDKIEHNLEENVPWNPDNARNKIYRTEIIQALAKKQKDNNTSGESSDDWKPRKRSSSCVKKSQNDAKSLEKMIQLVTSSENSDLFEGRQTDRTDGMQDGRKARMSLRNEDRHRHRETREPRDASNLETRKSESSECFLPIQKQTENKGTTTSLKVGKMPSTTTTNSIDGSSRRRESDEKMDWRLPATMSERRFELDQCSYRAGASSRLIDYVQMEKKNQLVWINNEISHLSNLKKLLEEPKGYSLHKNEDFNRCKEIDNNSSNFPERRINKQWSSHGNLVERRGKPAEMIPERRKNFCNQKGKNSDEFSKSNETEMMKPPPSNGMRTSSHCGQTMAETSREPSPIWSPRRFCTQHGNKKESCSCPRPTPSSLEPIPTLNGTHYRHKSSGDRRPITQPSTNSKKEDKNRLNDRCRSEFNDSEYHEQVSQEKGLRHCKSCRCAASDSSSSDKNQVHIEGEEKKKVKPSRFNNCTCDKVREARSCRVCGVPFSSDNRKCRCVQGYIKPIAYELSFEDEADHTKKEKTTQDSPSSSRSSEIMQPQLKDYMKKNKPELVNKIETRKRYMSEISQLRELKKEKRNQFLALASPSSFIPTQKISKPITKSSKKISDEEMKTRLRLRYLRLNEVRNKRHQKEKEEQARKNHLMAKIFGMKLQQKVLKGQVDLSQSMSVISNL